MGQRVYYERNGVQLLAPILPAFERILTVDALALVAQITRASRSPLQQLLAAREARQIRYDAGTMPDFDPDTRNIREDDWTVAPIPGYLSDRTVEVVCPAGNRKMLLGALNSKKDGAPITLGDLEDANGCQWGSGGTVDGLNNLYDAARRTLDYEHPKKGRQMLDQDYGWLMMRPRGLHFTEPRMLVDGQEVPAFIFDVALHLYHNALPLLSRGQGADLYLPKLEHADEAKWCNAIIGQAEYECGIPEHSTKVSVLFEHVLGTLQIEEIIYYLRQRFVAGNTGWLDYLASLSRVMRYRDDYVMPDPSSVDVRTPCMAAYLDLVVAKCHQRGAMAIGGTATQVAVPGDDAKTADALRSVKNNAAPYVQKGFDGGWVVYAPFAGDVSRYFKSAFIMGHTNQMFRTNEGTVVTAAQLLEPPSGDITGVGLNECIAGGISYYAGWLSGIGAVAITYADADGNYRCRLMEDAATGQRKREDTWKWCRLGIFSKEDVVERMDAFLGCKREELGEEVFVKSTFKQAASTFMIDVIGKDAPPDYFPPVLLELIVDQELKQFVHQDAWYE